MTAKRSRTTQSGAKAPRKIRTRTGEKKTPRRRSKIDSDEDEEKSQRALKKSVLDAAHTLAKSSGARKILISAESLGNLELITGRRRTEVEVVLVTRNQDVAKQVGKNRGPVTRIVEIADVHLGRMALIKVALVNALVSGAIAHDDRVVFVCGPATPGALDTIVLLDPRREAEMFAFDSHPSLGTLRNPHVFEEFLKLAIEISHQGREGKPVGTIFAIGDHENVIKLSRQMIMNPFKGYAAQKCSIFNPEIRDTIREFSALDGAFVVRSDGVVLCAGRLLSVTAMDAAVPKGLGSRHAAGAGITESTKALAITISETDGCVRIFKGGRVLTKIEKPAD